MIKYIKTGKPISIIKLAHRNCWFGEYQCDNGECIRAAYLCDGTQDCKDASDEFYCDLQSKKIGIISLDDLE